MELVTGMVVIVEGEPYNVTEGLTKDEQTGKIPNRGISSFLRKKNSVSEPESGSDLTSPS